MGRTSAPPLDGKAIRSARLRQFLTQAEVAAQVAELVRADDIKFDRSGLSYIENGDVKRPSLKVIRALAGVLGMEPDQMFRPEDEEDEAEEDEAA